MKAHARLFITISLALLLFFGTVIILTPIVEAMGGAANAMCTGDPAEQFPMDQNKNGMIGVIGKPCQETVSGGTTFGKCLTVQFCEGQSHSGGAGQSGGGLGMEQLMQALQGIMGALKGGGGGGGGGGGSGSGSGSGMPPDFGSQGSQGCVTYTPTSDPNSADPCTYYVAGNYTGTSGTGSSGTDGTYTLPNGSTVQAGCTTYYATSDPNDPDPCTYYEAAGTSGDGASGAGAGGTGGSSGGAECSSYTQTSDPNSKDPCTFFVPPAGIGSGANAVQSASGVGPGADGMGSDAGSAQSAIKDVFSDTASDIFNGNDNEISSENEANIDIDAGSEGSIFKTFMDTIMGVRGGAEGNIDLSDKGATIYAGGHDPESNTSAAGFYGTDTFGTQPQGLVARLCFNRPWASTFFSTIIPPSFFDNLCKWRGYELGGKDSVPGADPRVQLQTVLLKDSQSLTPSSDAASNGAGPKPSAPPPEVLIWASPKEVAIGGRTSIFWTSRNAVSCLVTSPDGNFHETALAGGASTVPLPASTVFTITCSGRDGASASGSVVVRIAI